MAEIKQELLLTPQEIEKAWEDTFEEPVSFDHKPTAEEIFNLRLESVAKAQLAHAEPLIRKQQQVEDTAYYAEKMKEAIDRVRITARKDERERICKEIERHFYKQPIGGDILISLNDTEWQALKGEGK